MQRLAILGGTFNPVHWGHLLIAETALDQHQLHQVIWVPSYAPPHRHPSEVLDIHHRATMVQQAIAPHPAFRLSIRPAPETGSSYAIHTLLDLQQTYPNSQWYWILGLDAFCSLPRWYRRQDLALHCQWLIAPRQADNTQTQELCQHVAQKMADQNIMIRWHLLQMPLIHLSSGLIRQYCGDRRSIRYLVPDAVRDYIHRNNLYEKQT